MSYGVEFTPAADEAIAALPGMVAHEALNEVERLAEDPVRLGRRSHFPYLPDRQIYQFLVDSDQRWWVSVFFRYTQDEKRIIILDVAATQID